MINYFKRTIKDNKLNKLNEFNKGCWINVVDPSEEEFNLLESEFNLDKQNLISGLDKDEIPRVESDEDYVYIILKVISPNNKDLHTILIVLTNSFILTLSKYKLDFIEKILDGKIELITTQKSKSLLKFLSLINKDFETSTYSIVKLVNSTKKSVSELNEKDLNILLEQEGILNSFISSYYYFNTVYERIIKNIKFYEEDKEIIEDLIIEARQGFELCKASLKTISNLRDHSVIMLSNKLTKVITLLTIFTVLISIPAAIFGLYGMNIVLPLQNHPLIFNYIVFLILVIWLAFILYFKKNKIL